MITSVFVYGTLKRSQCRGGMWPAVPLSIQPAWVRGRLYSRRDYPALRWGDDRVLGELWSFAADDLPRVLTALDVIEGTNQPGHSDLYHRIITPVWDLEDQPLGEAFGYHYATDPLGDGFRLVQATSDDDWVRWP